MKTRHGKIKRLRKALRDLVTMNLRLDPSDEHRREMRAAIRMLKGRGQI